MSPEPRIGLDARKIRDSGIGRYLEGLLGALARREGPERYVLFLSDPHAALPGNLDAVLPSPRFTRQACPAPLYSLREIVAFRGVARRFGLDLLHFPHYVRGLSPGCPVCVTIHDAIHLSHPPSLPAALYARAMMTWSARTADVLLAPSETARRDIATRLGLDPSRFVVAPNGVDVAFSRPPREVVDRFRAARGLASEYLYCVGTHRSHKNVAAAIRAFVEASLEGVMLVLAAADARTADALLPFERPDVRVLRDVPDAEMPCLYAGARGVLAPSLAEGFGLGPLEALACGAPVLASAIPAHREVLGDDAAWFDPAEGGAALAEAIRAFWRDEPLRAALASRGPARARSFTWERTASITLDAYRSAVDRRRGVRESTCS